MALIETAQDVNGRFQDLVLDLNLDQITADEAWRNYETLKLRYAMEGDQMLWVSCAVYEACMQRTLPTVGGRQGSTVQGNCVSLTRMLRFCNITFPEFLKKKRLWLKMTHLDNGYIKLINLLETKYSVSKNIFMKYCPIFLDLFADPSKDEPRPPRSRKQRRLPCNATELYHFCWTLYILIKGKYSRSTQDLVSSYSMLMCCVDLIYTNVKDTGRTNLLNQTCGGFPDVAYTSEGLDCTQLPDSMIDYLCGKFHCVVVETKVVQRFYMKQNIEDFIEKKLLKGPHNGMCLLESQNFDYNVKEVRNAYETELLSSGEFDERMFLSNDKVLGLTGSNAASPVSSASVTPMPDMPNRTLILPGDRDFQPQTPITGRASGHGSPGTGQHQQYPYSPIAAVYSAINKLYHLTKGRNAEPSAELAAMLQSVSYDPTATIKELLVEMSITFYKLYCALDLSKGGTGTCNSNTDSPQQVALATAAAAAVQQDISCADIQQETLTPTPGLGTTVTFARMRLRAAKTLFYSLLESILRDETRRKGDIEAFVKQNMFFRTLFVCCVELVLKCYNDPLKFPWSLQIGGVPAYYFVRIIEPLVRSEQQQENRLPRDLVNHLKRIEEQVLDSLVWQSESPLWQILEDDAQGVPSCKDVNFSDLLDNRTGISSNGGAGSGDSITSGQLQPPASVIMSPHHRQRTPASPRQSPLSSASSERLGLQSPPGGNKGSVKRTLLFPPDTAPNTSPGNNYGITAPLPPPPSDVPSLGNQTNGSASPTVLQEQQQSKDESIGQKPRRHGSLGLFFRKVYNVASLRLCCLCEKLKINTVDLRRKIWTVLEYAIINHTSLLQDRHLDQLIMCTTYTVCKVTGEDRTLSEIMKQYRCQPQADSHIYRSVLIRRTKPESAEDSSSGSDTSRGSRLPPPSPAIPRPSTSLTPIETRRSSAANNMVPGKVNGTSTSFKNEERGDLIRFYNHVYVPVLRAFALRFRENNSEEGYMNMPPLSPLPMVRVLPVSPCRRISATRPVFVRGMGSIGPAASSPRQSMQHFFNRSPAKNLRTINTIMSMRAGGSSSQQRSGSKRPLGDDSNVVAGQDTNNNKQLRGLSRRLNTVLDERQQSSTSAADSAPADAVLLQEPNSVVGLARTISNFSNSSADTVILSNGDLTNATGPDADAAQHDAHG
uniref:Retinoblastoma-like protein 2 n=1 Tax=Hirondellea gigas TaxID=1518452 RepID=A0A6A7FZ97_9CRUS